MKVVQHNKKPLNRQSKTYRLLLHRVAGDLCFPYGHSADATPMDIARKRYPKADAVFVACAIEMALADGRRSLDYDLRRIEELRDRLEWLSKVERPSAKKRPTLRLVRP